MFFIYLFEFFLQRDKLIVEHLYLLWVKSLSFEDGGFQEHRFDFLRGKLSFILWWLNMWLELYLIFYYFMRLSVVPGVVDPLLNNFSISPSLLISLLLFALFLSLYPILSLSSLIKPLNCMRHQFTRQTPDLFQSDIVHLMVQLRLLHQHLSCVFLHVFPRTFTWGYLRMSRPWFVRTGQINWKGMLWWRKELILRS